MWNMRNKEALRELRRVIEAAPDELLQMRALHEKCECGTAYCALGWAVQDPYFVEKFGRELQRKHGWTNGTAPGLLNLGFTRLMEVTPAVFGIVQENANRLFASDINYYKGPYSVSKAEVLWNIDQLLAGKPPRYYEAATLTHRASSLPRVPQPEEA
jgi:hypothetical protein